jgi:3-deoxy-D-manno-octulosonic-acid transferase
MHRALRLPYAVAALAADVAARLPIPGESKVARSLRARRTAVAHLEQWAATHRDTARPLLWMHAPSVGEGLQARPVLERLRARHPDWQLLYTFFSPSAEPFADALDVDVRGYLPFDRRTHAARSSPRSAPRRSSSPSWTSGPSSPSPPPRAAFRSD